MASFSSPSRIYCWLLLCPPPFFLVDGSLSEDVQIFLSDDEPTFDGDAVALEYYVPYTRVVPTNDSLISLETAELVRHAQLGRNDSSLSNEESCRL